MQWIMIAYRACAAVPPSTTHSPPSLARYTTLLKRPRAMSDLLSQHVFGLLVSPRWRDLLANSTGSETLCATHHVPGPHLPFRTIAVCTNDNLTTRLEGFGAKRYPGFEIGSAPRGAMRSRGVAIGVRCASVNKHCPALVARSARSRNQSSRSTPNVHSMHLSHMTCLSLPP
jgi:hypothetical protein